jgi:dCTP deaminase
LNGKTEEQRLNQASTKRSDKNDDRSKDQKLKNEKEMNKPNETTAYSVKVVQEEEQPDTTDVQLSVEVKSASDEKPGVLLSSEIVRLSEGPLKMISPFYRDKKRLKPAAYHLSLGKHYRIARKTGLLSDRDPYLKIEPYQVAIVETWEELNMPPNVIGRWNLRISGVYKGLLWVGGPQVDPCFRGHLYCPLYNLSTVSVTLVYKEPFATIDFVRTTDGRSVPFDQKRRKMSDYDTELESAPAETLKKVNRVERRVQVFESTMLTTIGIIIAALAIIAGSNYQQNVTNVATLWIVIGAVATFVAGLLIGLVARRGG